MNQDVEQYARKMRR